MGHRGPNDTYQAAHVIGPGLLFRGDRDGMTLRAWDGEHEPSAGSKSMSLPQDCVVQAIGIDVHVVLRHGLSRA